MKLEANRVGGEGAARQARPLDRALALFDVLLAGAAVVVEDNDALGRPRQVGDDETDARIKLAGVPLDPAFARAGSWRRLGAASSSSASDS
jgi:hypothetical protein